MAFLTNIWSRYTDRTADQMKDNVVTNLQSQVPEITDHSESNLFIKLVNMFTGLLEGLNYNIDNVGRESHMDSARLYSNVVRLSRSWDYRISSQQAAQVQLTISYISTSVLAFPGATIPSGSIVQTANGIQFVTVEPLVITSGSFSTAKGQVSATNVIAIPYTSLGTSDGTANQILIVNDKISGFTATIRVGGIDIYESVETFAYSLATDKHFIQTVNEDGEVIIKFGDGTNGIVPTLSDSLEIQYNQTNGIDGNVLGQTIVQIVGGFPVVSNYTVSVTNLEAAVAGTEVESAVSIKQNVARLFRTRNRAVTELDFVDIAILEPQVENAGVIFECGKTVNVYIVPIGGGLAPPSLLADVEAWFNDNRRIITHRIRAFTAGEIHIKGTIDVTAKSGFDLNQVQTNVENAWLGYFASTNQQISGTVRIGDIYEAVEAAEGVDYSVITLLNAEPYARAIGITNTVLDWDVITNTTSTTQVNWSILIVGASTYQLLKDSNFVGTFTIGVQVVQPEITFTVNASSYSNGDKWTFVSYPYGGNSILLDEPSIPVSDLTDLILNLNAS
jgi:hypothetical protein